MPEGFSNWYNGLPIIALGSADTGTFSYWYNGRLILAPLSSTPLDSVFSKTLDDLLLAGTIELGPVPLANLVDAVLADLTLSSTSESFDPLLNVVDAVLDDLVLSATVETFPPLGNVVDAVLEDLLLEATIEVGPAPASNVLDALLDDLTSEGVIELSITNVLDGLLDALTLSATSTVQVQNQVDSILDALVMTATIDKSRDLQADLTLDIFLRATSAPFHKHEVVPGVEKCCTRLAAPSRQCKTPATAVPGAGRKKAMVLGQASCLPPRLYPRTNELNLTGFGLLSLVSFQVPELENAVDVMLANFSLAASMDSITEFFYSVCRDEFYLALAVPDEETWTIQISTDEVTWADHVFVVGDGTPQIITLNNDYNGDYSFRVIDGASNVRRSQATPLASIVAPPSVSITNLEDASIARPLWADEGITYPYSNRENAYISPTETYFVPRQRLRLEITEDLELYRQPNIVTAEGPVGSITKWTRDGTDPTVDTTIRKLDGYDDNAAVYRNDFKLAVKARSFVDGCRSPMTYVLVDKRLDILEDFTSHGEGQLASAACDLPIDGSESGGGCQFIYGGVDQFNQYLKDYTVDNLEAVHNGSIVYTVQDDPDDSHTYLGWPVHTNAWSLYIHETSDIHRNDTVVQMPEAFTYAKVSITGAGIDEIYAGILGSPFGSAATLEANLTNYIIGNFPVGGFPEAIGNLSLTVLAPYFTLHDDSNFFHAPLYTPPVLNDPPVDEYNPLEEIFEDDFEAYLDADDATVVTLNEGTGWNDAWTVIAYEPTTGEDTFDQDADGEAVTGLAGGTLWETSWTIQGFADGLTGEDTMDEYDDGVVGGRFLQGGEGWETDWVIPDYGIYRSGADSMQSYADSIPTSGTLLGGEGWEATTGWIFPI